MKETALFVIWTDEILSDLEACEKLWPQHKIEDQQDWDLGVRFHYIYHRYNLSFKKYFLAFLANTPNFKVDILNKLVNLYKEEKGITIEKQDIPVLTKMDAFGIPSNDDLKITFLNK